MFPILFNFVIINKLVYFKEITYSQTNLIYVS